MVLASIGTASVTTILPQTTLSSASREKVTPGSRNDDLLCIIHLTEDVIILLSVTRRQVESFPVYL